MKGIGFLSIGLAVAITIGCSNSNKSTDTTVPGAVGTSGAAADNVSRGDRDFVHDAAIANTAEAELGRLAADKATNAEVKTFAQMMVDDHTAALDKLTALASQNHIEIPTQLDDKHQSLKTKLSDKTGADFDKDYASEMVDGHKDFVDKLESRIDKKTLFEWKADMAARTEGKTVETKGKEIVVLPEQSDNPVTMAINRWAADTYPTAYAHLEAAKALDKNLKKRMTTP